MRISYKFITFSLASACRRFGFDKFHENLFNLSVGVAVAVAVAASGCCRFRCCCCCCFCYRSVVDVAVVGVVGVAGFV